MAIQTTERPYACGECSKTFSRSYNLQKHSFVHKDCRVRSYGCSTCGKRFTGRQALERHERSHTGERPFVCSTCGKGFTHSENLKKHQRNSCSEIIRTTSAVTVAILSTECVPDKDLQQQITAEKRSEIPAKISPLTLLNPCRGFKTLPLNSGSLTEAANRPDSKSYSQEKCILQAEGLDDRGQCEKTFDNMTSWLRQQISHSGDCLCYVCTTCGNQFFHKDALKAHQQQIHFALQSSLKIVSQQENSEIFPHAHLSSHNEGITAISSIPILTVTNAHTLNAGSLPMPIMINDTTNIDPIPTLNYANGYCNSTGFLRMPIPITNTINTGQIPLLNYADGYCDRTGFLLTPITVSDINTNTVGPIPISPRLPALSQLRPACMRCDRTFSSKDNLYRHLNVHKGVRRRYYPCSVCGKKLTRMSYLRQHQQIHGSPVNCDIPSDDISLRDKLQHPKTRKNEVHDIRTYLSITGNDLRLPAIADSQARTKLFPTSQLALCMDCGATFDDAQCFKFHQRTGVIKLWCSVCCKSFDSSDDVKKCFNGHCG